MRFEEHKGPIVFRPNRVIGSNRDLRSAISEQGPIGNLEERPLTGDESLAAMMGAMSLSGP